MSTTYQVYDQQIINLLLRKKYLIIVEGSVKELNQQELTQSSAQQQLPAKATPQSPKMQAVPQYLPQYTVQQPMLPQYIPQLPQSQQLPIQQQLFGDIFYVITINLANPINVIRWSPAIPIPQLSFTPISEVTLNEDALQTMGLMRNEQLLKIVSTASAIGKGLKALEKLVGNEDFVKLLNGGLGPDSDKAVIVLWDLPDNTHHDFVRELLLRRMRELGSEPNLPRSVIDEADSASNEIRFDVKVSSNVNQPLMIKCGLILTEKQDWKGKGSVVVAGWFKDRLRELMSKGGPVYVVIICEKNLYDDLFMKGYLFNAINELRDYVEGNLHVPFIELNTASITKSIAAESIEFAYLINGIKPPEKLPDTFDKAFGNALIQYKSRLGEIAENKYYVFVDRDKNESPEHIMLKTFIYYYLVKKKFDGNLKDAMDKIRTEYQVCNGVRADVVLLNDKSSYEIYEVETLFGEGTFSFKKVQESIMKYRDCSDSKIHVHVILEPLTATMHLNELWDIMNYINMLKKNGKISFEVSIETIDIDNEELIPLNDFIKKLGTTLP